MKLSALLMSFALVFVVVAMPLSAGENNATTAATAVRPGESALDETPAAVAAADTAAATAADAADTAAATAADAADTAAAAAADAANTAAATAAAAAVADTAAAAITPAVPDPVTTSAQPFSVNSANRTGAIIGWIVGLAVLAIIIVWAVRSSRTRPHLPVVGPNDPTGIN